MSWFVNYFWPNWWIVKVEVMLCFGAHELIQSYFKSCYAISSASLIRYFAILPWVLTVILYLSLWDIFFIILNFMVVWCYADYPSFKLTANHFLASYFCHFFFFIMLIVPFFPKLKLYYYLQIMSYSSKFSN